MDKYEQVKIELFGILEVLEKPTREWRNFLEQGSPVVHVNYLRFKYGEEFVDNILESSEIQEVLLRRQIKERVEIVPTPESGYWWVNPFNGDHTWEHPRNTGAYLHSLRKKYGQKVDDIIQSKDIQEAIQKNLTRCLIPDPYRHNSINLDGAAEIVEHLQVDKEIIEDAVEASVVALLTPNRKGYSRVINATTVLEKFQVDVLQRPRVQDAGKSALMACARESIIEVHHSGEFS